MIYMKHNPSNGIAIEATYPELFYDGRVSVEKGVCEVPKNKAPWIQRLKAMSYVEISENEFRQARGLPLKKVAPEEVPGIDTNAIKKPRQPR